MREHKAHIPFWRKFDTRVAKEAARTASSEMSPYSGFNLTTINILKIIQEATILFNCELKVSVGSYASEKFMKEQRSRRRGRGFSVPFIGQNCHIFGFFGSTKKPNSVFGMQPCGKGRISPHPLTERAFCLSRRMRPRPR